MFYVHKYEESQAYGGPEEGGWWYNHQIPCDDWSPIAITDEEAAYDLCRLFNTQENKRREELIYGYTSVLSYREEFFAFGVETSLVSEYPRPRPHYE